MDGRRYWAWDSNDHVKPSLFPDKSFILTGIHCNIFKSEGKPKEQEFVTPGTQIEYDVLLSGSVGAFACMRL